MKVGQLVKMSEHAHMKWGKGAANPVDEVGTVVEIGDRWIFVDWPYGQHNSYHHGDLIAIEAEAPKPQTVTGEAKGKSSQLEEAKTIYAVYKGNELIFLTPDREDARGLKFDLGGKRGGYKILAYGQAREIR